MRNLLFARLLCVNKKLTIKKSSAAKAIPTTLLSVFIRVHLWLKKTAKK
jgi:hypothetical protein